MDANLADLRTQPSLEGLKAWLALRALELVPPLPPVPSQPLADPSLYRLGFRAGEAEMIRELMTVLEEDMATLQAKFSALSSQAWPGENPGQ